MKKRLKFKNLTITNKLLRFLWNIVSLILFKTTPNFMNGWRIFLLKIFGANIGRGSYVYPSTKIWAPWNLKMGSNSCLSHHVNCYCVDKIVIGSNVTVSQYSHLCTASHDYNKKQMPLMTAPIIICDNVWLAMDVLIFPGVRINKGAVIGARSCVTKDVNELEIFAGYSAKKISNRKLV